MELAKNCIGGSRGAWGHGPAIEAEIVDASNSVHLLLRTDMLRQMRNMILLQSL